MFTKDELATITTEIKSRMREDEVYSRMAMEHGNEEDYYYFNEDYYHCKSIYEKAMKIISES